LGSHWVPGVSLGIASELPVSVTVGMERDAPLTNSRPAHERMAAWRVKGERTTGRAGCPPAGPRPTSLAVQGKGPQAAPPTRPIWAVDPNNEAVISAVLASEQRFRKPLSTPHSSSL